MARPKNYESYIGSETWRRRRARWLSANGRWCRGCGRTEDIRLHHKTYDRMGRELNTDLVALCTTCHQAVHDYHQTRITRFGKASLFESTDDWLALVESQRGEPSSRLVPPTDFVPLNKRKTYEERRNEPVGGRLGQLRGLPIVRS